MNRKGSALLIVLGVLSFLVVSAVAFSAFMRRARLPSSYLRRAVASRQLAKDALAEAIDQVDRAIANGVHPGIGGSDRNTWRNRVFFNGGGESSIALTAPTLTLEGLAYIPPPLVNEARYWSRKTPTAMWQSIPYDIGRYAYCAIDVSDYFDVNRLTSTYPRSSAANRRITISHLFEPSSANNPHNAAPSGAKKWDEFMSDFREIDDKTLEIDFDSSSKIPLVSLADFNLALADNGPIGNIRSAFGEYIEKNMSQFYPGNSSEKLRPYAEMTFVTDGLFPRSRISNDGGDGSTATVERYDIGDGKYQPYQMADLRKDDSIYLSEALAFYKTQIAPSNESKTWWERLCGFGMAALADYLDEDHYPISLAVPTTEQVPMICAIEPKLSQQPVFAVEPHEGNLTGVDGGPLDNGEQATERKVEQIVRWKIKGDEFGKAFMGGKIHALVAYPFLHRGTQSSDWKLDGIFSMFLTTGSVIPFRTSNESDSLHLSQQNLPDTGVKGDTGVMTIKLGEAKPNFPAEYDKEEDAVWEGDLDMRAGVDLAAKFSMDGNELLKVTYRWTQKRQKKPEGGMGDWTPTFEDVQADPGKCDDLKATTMLPALNGNGKEIGSRSQEFSEEALAAMVKAKKSVHVHLNAALWLRVKEGDEVVVDMVPASISDDEIQNPDNKDPGRTVIQRQGSMKADGNPFPVLKFTTKVEFDFGVDGMKALEGAGKQLEIEPRALMVPDPRHNHAPENWFADNAGSITKSKWLESNLVGSSDDRDGDIFMATSDAGYLQSIYELAFLPRFSNPANQSGTVTGNCQIPGNNWRDGAYATSAGGTLNADLMWHTYDPVGEDRVAFENFPFTNEGTGMKVNPYSDSTNVLMAAFANTPISWRYAHTNYEFSTELKQYQKDAAGFNQKYAWNSYSSGAGFAWNDLEKVAGRFMRFVRDERNWKTAWNKMEWYDLCRDGQVFPAGGGAGTDMQMSDETDELWDADRKFLYGFWRDCFDAKQQLFLIFVRAEPLLLGGGTADQLPPQLGARAVALVWRDPSTSSTGTSNGYPHRTRVLFYRPLD